MEFYSSITLHTMLSSLVAQLLGHGSLATRRADAGRRVATASHGPQHSSLSSEPGGKKVAEGCPRPSENSLEAEHIMVENEDTRWNGFLVVRLPSDNRDSNGLYSLPTQPPQMDHIFYGGIDRMPWSDIDEAFYNGSLPPTFKQLRQAIKDDNSDFSGMNLCKSF